MIVFVRFVIVILTQALANILNPIPLTPSPKKGRGRKSLPVCGGI